MKNEKKIFNCHCSAIKEMFPTYKEEILKEFDENGKQAVESIDKSYPLDTFSGETQKELKNQFTEIMHEAIDTTPYPALHYEAYTKTQLIEILKKYARHIKVTHARKVAKL